MTRWISRPLVLALALLALVAVLGALQYSWLGEVSDAERDRVRAHLRQCAEDVSAAFNAEVTRAFVMFQTPPEQFDRDPSGSIATAYDAWHHSAAAPDIIEAVYVVTAGSPNAVPAALSKFDPATKSLVDTAWPEALARWRDRDARFGLRRKALLADPIESTIPAVTIGVPHVKLLAAGDDTTYVPDLSGPNHLVIVAFDRTRLRDDLVAPLVARYFGAAASDYSLSIGSSDDATVIYSTSADGRPVSAAQADTSTGIFDLQVQDLSRLHAENRLAIHQQLAITIVRSTRIGASRALVPGTPGSGAWQLRARHRSGSLEALVARSRRRNLAISFAILAILGASVVLITMITERRQRLARQQMEFVASVSHELRTPLAVICSAGENLADGVVTDASQVRRYGALVRTEGRRLTDMVERVLAFAGMAARPLLISARGDVDLGQLVKDAAGELADDAADRGVVLEAHAPRGCRLRGDADALRSALQNVIGNAIKYSARGSTVRVEVGDDGAHARVRVSDAGLGIDAADLPHVWEPFYRGRRAAEAQVRGSGIGLSIVRQVVRAHGGDARIDSRPGEGTTVVIELPSIAAGAPIAERASA